MDELPLLIVYGGLVWKAALVLMVAGVALVRERCFVRRHSVVRRGSEERWGGTPVSEEELAAAERVLVEGPLCGYGAPAVGTGALYAAATVDTGDDGDAIKSCRAPLLIVFVGETKVLIEGDIQVSAGTDEFTWQGALPGLRDGLTEIANRIAPKAYRTTPAVFRAIKQSAIVRVTGNLTRLDAAVDEEPPLWVLKSSDAAVNVRAVAEARGPLPSIASAFVTGLIALALFAAIFGGIGAIATSTLIERNQYVSVIDPDSLSVLGAARLAAATPFHRDLALKRVSSDLETRVPPSLRTVNVADATYRLRGACLEAVQYLSERHLVDRARALASECPDDAEAWIARGVLAAWSADIEGSANALARVSPAELEPRATDLSLEAFILTERWEDAIRVVEHATAQWQPAPGGSSAFSKMIHPNKADLECLLLGLNARAGDSTAFDRLLRRPDDDSCVLLAMDGSPPEKGALMRSLTVSDSEREQWLQRLIHARAGGAPAGAHDTNPYGTFFEVQDVAAPTGSRRWCPLGMTLDAADRESIRGTPFEVDVLVHLASWHALVDREEEANAYLARARRAMTFSTEDRALAELVEGVEVGLALRRGDAAAAWAAIEGLEPKSYARRRVEVLYSMATSDWSDPPGSVYGLRTEHIAAALAGNGEPLLRTLSGERIGPPAWIWLSVLARRLGHLDGLSELLRYRPHFFSGNLFHFLELAAQRGHLARGLGEDEWADLEFARAQALFDVLARSKADVLLYVARQI